MPLCKKVKAFHTRYRAFVGPGDDPESACRSSSRRYGDYFVNWHMSATWGQHKTIIFCILALTDKYSFYVWYSSQAASGRLIEQVSSRLSLLLCLLNSLHAQHAHMWRGGATGRALDMRSTGRGFKSYSGQKLRNNLGQVGHTYVHPSPSSITWYRPTGGDELRLER